MITFRDLGVSEAVVRALEARGIESPFPIQVMVIEDATSGRDTLARSKTGSGKTLGFAIPIDQVKITADQILRTGRARYPVIGSSVDTGDTTDTGAKILGVTSGSPAAKAGIRKGDLVTEVAGAKVATGIALIVAIRSHQPGETLAFTVERDGDERVFEVTLDSEVG